MAFLGSYTNGVGTVICHPSAALDCASLCGRLRLPCRYVFHQLENKSATALHYRMRPAHDDRIFALPRDR